MEQMLMSVARRPGAWPTTVTGAREALEFRDKVVAEVAPLPLVTAYPMPQRRPRSEGEGGAGATRPARQQDPDRQAVWRARSTVA
jgi:hypothetical protein